MNLNEAYSILELQPSSSEDDVKKKFKSMAVKFHPDKNNGDDKKFKQINEAFQTIQNKDNINQHNNPHVQHIDLNEILRQHMSGFGGGFGFGRQPRNHMPNVVIDKKISFKDSIYGIAIQVEYDRTDACHACQGRGVLINQVQRNNFTHVNCLQCSKTGNSNKKFSGTINVPGGTKNGVTFRIAGAGHHMGDGFFTDLHLNIYVESDNRFNLIEEHLHYDVNLSLKEAVLGCKKTIPTLDNEMEITIPPMSKNKDSVIIPNKGANRQGNQVNVINIEYPENIKEIVESWQ